MNIALVSPYDYAYPGGVNTHISNLALHLAKMGHQVKILAPCSNKKALPAAQGIIPLGKTIPYPSNGSVARLTLSWWLMPKVKSILNEERFDILHFHEPLFPSLPWMVLPLSHSVNVATFHAFYKRSLGYWFWKPLVKGYYSRLDGKIAVSEPAKRFVSRYFPGDYRVIPHGVDLERFSAEVPPIEDFCDGKLNILFVSRLEERKGIRYLLKAFRVVKAEFPQSRLIVVGPGNGRRYKDYVQAVKLKDVVFVGYASYDSLPRYYRTADIFCVPAVGQESFGIVLLEAMAAGKPIVASNIDGYANVLTHQAEGLLVPPKNKEALAHALLSLLNDQALRQQMGNKGRSKAEAHKWEVIAQRNLDYYLELLGEKVDKSL
jgi:phosphatidylinositol alpha-mannosyltransferase